MGTQEATRTPEARTGRRASAPRRVLLWILFVVASVVFATSAAAQLGTLAGFAAALGAAIAVVWLTPGQRIGGQR